MDPTTRGESTGAELARLRALVAAIPDPIYRIHSDGTFLRVEVPDGEPDAVPQESIPGQSIQQVMPPRQAAVVLEGIGQATASGQMVTVEYDGVIAGVHRWWEARLVPDGDEVLAIVREITERRRSDAETLHWARTDPLTGLANRAAFDEALELAVARSYRSGRPFAVLFTDLDRFKGVNDQFGHVVGDTVLADATARIRDQLRDVDLAARVGGDELGVLIEEVESSEDVDRVAHRLVEAVGEPFEAGGAVHRIGLSVGIAMFPEHASTPLELLAAADRAMYEAKHRGGSQVAWSGLPG